MRLSKLHIAGFKSFPDRAELGFDQGVTAIVGPNGCGKSNVVDAITWVLGEQSAKSLRGERMEDVIFSGSDARKPTASAEVRLKLSQVAQVAMLVATGEGETPGEQPVMVRDVEIGRRVYRSGESEYLIDGEVCRLRDVHDLLMDSGLGVKAYAVIEQGKIGQILASRPAERRMLIEEAAGVTKYKSRRRSAELKLEAAQQNLTRIDDIIFEVEKQRGSLKRQASRARRYKRLREELRKWEQVQFAHRCETLAKDVQVAEARLEDARVKAAAEVAHVAELEAAIEAVRLGLAEGESAATGARERAHAHDLEIGRRQQQAQFDRQQISELARQADVYTAEVHELDARRVPADEAIATQQAAARSAIEALSAAKADVEAREADYARALTAVQAVEQASDSTRAAVLSSNTTLAALRQARDHAATMRDRVAAELERLDLESRELAADAERVVAHKERSATALAETGKAREQLQTRRIELQAALAAHRSDRERVSSALGERQRELAGKDARLRSLEQLDASRATFGDAARFLLADSSHQIRKDGAVADHLSVERSYERAVDAILGDHLQYVVVERADDVATGLQLLNDRQVGRCGFVVLEDARGAAAGPEGELLVGVRSLASVVKTTGPHADVLSALLAGAFVADSFEAARTLARTVDGPVATLTGEVFHRGWIVQGGSRRDVRGILETRAEITALRSDVEETNHAIQALKDELARATAAIGGDEQTLGVLVTELHEREKAIVGLEAQARSTADEQTRVNRRLDVVGTERARAAEAQSAAEQRREEATVAIDEHAARQRDAEANLAAVFAQLQTVREHAEAKLRLVTEGRTTQATLIERASALTNEVARLEEARRELESRIASRAAEIRRTEARREELRASIVETERVIDDSVRLLDVLRSKIQGLDERVITLRAEFSERDHAIRAARQALDAVRTQVTGLEVSLARTAADLAHLETTCVEAVGISLAEVVAVVAALDAAGELVPPGRRAIMAVAGDGDDDDAEGSAVIESDAVETGESAVDADGAAGDPSVSPDEVIVILRKRIDRLGPVNMMAIEQFDDLETRHSFLTTQRTDLLESIAQTGEAIRKIDKTTRERFSEAFAAINLNFEKTFTTLFGGGRAGLVLIDQENDTESGIDIIAQPPGKRLQNVQLLSGGEKALTAMALMFAVFKFRPSPFCLLDEIDAPLDDANIGRFVDMLQSMQDNTQFILITHHRKTMEIADRLYGVTMEEPGVSKLISLQLN